MTRSEEIKKASYELSGSCNETYKMVFEAGAMWADNNPKSPWISVEDDLPCNNPNNIHFGFTNRVLTTDGNNIFILYMKKCKDGKWIWCGDDNNVDLSHIITHWMPIPKLPN